MARKDLIFLNLIKNLSPKKKEEIISCFECPNCILEYGRSQLRKIASLNEKDIDTILASRDSGILDKELADIEKEKVKVIDIYDDQYPSLLKEISHPPLVIYIKGNPSILNKTLFSIVGSRMPTSYGIAMAEEFSYQLASLGFVIASGMARGVDSIAHKAALKVGQTIAVLGSGLKHIYPPENKGLAQDIERAGAVISEFSLNEPPSSSNFPRRNRIISGLALGVLVIEAALRSGALITARFGNEQNREIFALPGKIDSPLSKGTNFLIKEGAKLVDSIEDIIEELPVKLGTT